MHFHTTLLPLPWCSGRRDGRLHHGRRERGQSIQLARSYWMVRVLQGLDSLQGVGNLYYGTLSGTWLLYFVSCLWRLDQFRKVTRCVFISYLILFIFPSQPVTTRASSICLIHDRCIVLTVIPLKFPLFSSLYSTVWMS